MTLKTWWRDLLGESRPQPPAILTEAEAVERIQAYAASKGHIVESPFSLGLKRQRRSPHDPAAGFHYVYHFSLGTSIPPTFVEVDAHDGTVLAWHDLPQ